VRCQGLEIYPNITKTVSSAHAVILHEQIKYQRSQTLSKPVILAAIMA